MKVSLVVVCHRSFGVLGGCVESFRREAAAAGVTAEVVAVEQSEDAEELRAISGMGVDRVVERPNRGYGAGLNAGSAEASGEVLLLANPDIVFLPESLNALLAALQQDFDVVGPQFVWDDEQRVLLPPAENPSPAAELWRCLRRRWRWAWSAGLGRSLSKEWQQWNATAPQRVANLRGALMAVSRQDFDRFGFFDEGYFLYYEETDWLWRARRAGARIGCVPQARVRHRWATPPATVTIFQTTKKDPARVLSDVITAGCGGPSCGPRQRTRQSLSTPPTRLTRGKRHRHARSSCGWPRRFPTSYRLWAACAQRVFRKLSSIFVGSDSGTCSRPTVRFVASG